MAPPASTDVVAGRYVLYKQGTSRLVQWIVNAASSCRCSVTTSASGGTVSTKELLRYTEFLVSWRPPVEIPPNIIELAEEVIIGRALCADFYTARGQSDEGHEVFIEVLQIILKKLKEARDENRKGRKKEKEKMDESKTQKLVDPQLKKGKREAALSNLFENLQIESVSENVRNVKVKRTPKTMSKPSSAPRLEVDKESDTFFAIWCLSQDFLDIREVVLEAWREYRDGKSSACVATAVTEVAWELMGSAEASAVELNPLYWQCLRDMQARMSTQLMTPGRSKIDTLHASHSQESAFFTLFAELWQVLRDSQSPWPEIFMLSTTGKSRDESLCFTGLMLLYLEIDIIMRGRTYDAINIANLQEKRMNRVYKKYIDFSKGCHGQMKSNVEILKKWISGREQQARLRESIPEARALQTDLILPWPNLEIPWLWENLPVMNGATLSKQQRDCHFTSIGIGNQIGVLVALAHLYRAAQHAHVLEANAWKDMEWFIEEHGRERPLVLEVKPDGELDAYRRHLWMFLGVSSRMYGATKPRALETKHASRDLRTTPRKLKSPSILLRTAAEQMQTDVKQGAQTFSFPHNFLHSGLAKSKALKRPAEARSNNEAHEATGAQLLRTFKAMRARDEPGLNFDYVSFWMACAQILRNLRSMAQQNLEYRPDACCCPECDTDFSVVPYIIDEVVRAKKSKPSDALERAGKIMQDFIGDHGSKFTTEAFALAAGQIPEIWKEEMDEVKVEVPSTQLPTAFLTLSRAMPGDSKAANGNDKQASEAFLHRGGGPSYRTTVEDAEDIEEQDESSIKPK